MHGIHYFAGGNTALGFFSCFPDVLPAPEQKRMYYLKGGPGVGKSSLMKRVAEAAEQRGHEVSFFHCSSDPDSLDAITLPQLGVGMMDGTAPHVYDPLIPGARDTLISLGDFLDEHALIPRVREISRIQQELSACFGRCYRYLAAAREVHAAAPAGAENAHKAAALCSQWGDALPLRGGTGRVRRLFASAFTPKGLIDVLDFSRFDRRITVDCPFGAHATGLMQSVSRCAAGRGLDVVQLLDPLSPGEIAHVILPEHGMAFCTGRRTERSAGEWTDAEALFDLSPAAGKEQGFDRNAFELLCERALEQLRQAKSLHDELEGFYVRAMDYHGWQQALDKVLAALP